MITDRHVKKPEGELVITVLSGTILAVLLWVCIVVYDIQTDLKEVQNTLEINKKLLQNVETLPNTMGTD